MQLNRDDYNPNLAQQMIINNLTSNEATAQIQSGRRMQNTPWDVSLGSNWFDRVGVAATAWNSVVQFYELARRVNDNYIEPNYIAGNDPSVKNNKWIKNYYPAAWEELNNSKSSFYTHNFLKDLFADHRNNMIFSEGSLVGNLAAGLIGAFADPINYVAPLGGLRSLTKAGQVSWFSQKARKVLAIPALEAGKKMTLTTGQMARVNAFENIIIGSAVEPILQESDYTRNLGDASMDLLAGAGMGALVPYIGNGAKRTAILAKRRANRAAYGHEDVEEFLQANLDSIHRSLEDTEEKTAHWRLLEDEPSRALDETVRGQGKSYLIEAFEAAQEGSSGLLGLKENSKLAKFLGNWMRLNPEQRLLFNKDKKVRIVAQQMLRHNLMSDIKPGDRAAIEEIVDIVDTVLSEKEAEMPRIIEEGLGGYENTSINPLTAEQYRSLAGILHTTGYESVDEAIRNGGGIGPSEKVGELDYNRFDVIKNDPAGKKIVENLSKLEKELQDLHFDAAVNAGFFNRVAMGLDPDSNPATYLARVMDDEKMSNSWYQAGDGTRKSLFIDSLERGIEEQRNTLRQRLKNLKTKLSRAYDNRLQTIERHSGSEADAMDLKHLLARLNATKEELAILNLEGKKWLDARNDLAARIAHNYETDPTGIGPKSGTGTGTNHLLSRKVKIDDKWLMPWRITDISALNARKRQWLAPQVAMSMEMMLRHEGNRWLHQTIASRVNDLNKAKEELKALEGQAGSAPERLEQITGDIRKAIADAIDDIRDFSEELAVQNHIRLLDTNKTEITDPRTITEDNKDGTNFESPEAIADYIRGEISGRKERRQEIIHQVLKINRLDKATVGLTNREINALKQIRKLEDSLEQSDIQFDQDPLMEILTPTIAGINTRPFMPLELSGKPIQESTDATIEYELNKAGALVTYVTPKGGQKRKTKLSKTKGAKRVWGRAEDTIEIKRRGGVISGHYVQFRDADGKDKFMWVDPEELAKRRAELDHTKRDKFNKEAEAIRAEKELRSELNGDWRSDHEQQIKVGQAEINQRNIAVEEIQNRPDLQRNRKSKEDAHEKLKELTEAWEARAVELNDVAAAVSRKLVGKKGIDREVGTGGLAKKHFRTATDAELSDGSAEFIGFGSRLAELESYGYSPGIVLSRQTGPSATARLIGVDERGVELGKDMIGAFEAAVYKAEAALRDNAYFNSSSLPLRQLITRTHTEAGLSRADLARAHKDIDYIVDGLLRRNPYASSSDQAARVLKNINYMRYMGMVVVSSLSDTANAVGTLGLKRYVRSMWKYLGTPDRDGLSDLARMVAVGEQAMLRDRFGGVESSLPSMDPISGEVVKQVNAEGPFGRAVDWLDKKTGQGSWVMDKYNTLNFLPRWNAFQKRFVTIAVEDMVTDIGIKLNKGHSVDERDVLIARAFGFNEKDLKKIGKLWDKHGESVTAILGRDLYLMHSDRWAHDGSFAVQTRAKIKSAVDNIIVTPTIGSNPAWAKRGLLSLIWQFKSYLSASTDLIFLPAIQRGMVLKRGVGDQAMMAFGTTMMGSLSYTIYEILAGRDPFKDVVGTDADGNETRSSWASNMVLSGLDRGGTFAGLFELNNVLERNVGYGAYSILGGRMHNKFRARTMTDTLLGPSWGLLQDAMVSMNSVIDLDPLTESQATARRRLIFGQNLWPVKLLLDFGPSALDSMQTSTPYFEGFKSFQHRFVSE